MWWSMGPSACCVCNTLAQIDVTSKHPSTKGTNERRRSMDIRIINASPTQARLGVIQTLKHRQAPAITESTYDGFSVRSVIPSSANAALSQRRFGSATTGPAVSRATRVAETQTATFVPTIRQSNQHTQPAMTARSMAVITREAARLQPKIFRASA